MRWLQGGIKPVFNSGYLLRGFSTLFILCSFSWFIGAWEAKDIRLSNTTRNIFGFFTVRIACPAQHGYPVWCCSLDSMWWRKCWIVCWDFAAILDKKKLEIRSINFKVITTCTLGLKCNDNVCPFDISSLDRWSKIKNFKNSATMEVVL